MTTPVDPLAPTEELISFALSHPPTDDEPDPYWEVIRALHGRGTREVFDAATRLLASACPVERSLGVNIHAQLGYEQQKPFAAESVRLLVKLLEVEENEDVIYDVLFAFGHLQEPECVPAALRFAKHPDADMRYGVTYALTGQDDENAIAALIVLTNDADVKVRDWATFDLASQTEWDSPALRAALWARTSDSDNITRGEALKGLALRKDARTTDAILAELDGPNPHENAVEAAEILADSRLIPALERLRVRLGGDDVVERVIGTCRMNN